MFFLNRLFGGIIGLVTGTVTAVLSILAAYVFCIRYQMKRCEESLFEALIETFVFNGHIWAIGSALFSVALPFRGAIVGLLKGPSAALTFPYQYFKDVWDFIDCGWPLDPWMVPAFPCCFGRPDPGPPEEEKPKVDVLRPLLCPPCPANGDQINSQESKNESPKQFPTLPNAAQKKTGAFLDTQSLSFLKSSNRLLNNFFKPDLRERSLLQRIQKLDDEVQSVQDDLKSVNGTINRFGNGFIFKANPHNPTADIPTLDHKLMTQTRPLLNSILKVVDESAEHAKSHPLSARLIEKVYSLIEKAKSVFPFFTPDIVSTCVTKRLRY